MNINSTKNTFNVNNDVINRKNSNRNKHKGYTKGEKWVIIITILITLLGILLRSWRIIREGMPIAFDVYHFQEEAKQVFFKGWFNFEELYRDPPGMYFIFVIAEFLLGLPGKPIMWSFFVIPQVIAAIQLIIFYVLARRLTQSRMTGLLSMLVMSFVGVIVYRNQNGAPETIVLGLIPFLVFYLLRFLETDDIRYMFIAIFTTIAIVLVHHLTTFIALVIWHIILIYDFIYRHIKKKQFSYKIAIINFTVLILLDSFVFIFWIYVLKNYPLEFINNSFGGLFPENQPIVPTILLIVGVIIINLILLSIFFYNFNRKRINSIIVISGVVSIFLIFILVLFYGTASPDTSITAALLFGTPILVIPPLASIGLIALEKNFFARGRVIRSYLYSILVVISITAIFPLLSSLLARLALYIIGIGVILAVIGIVKIISKINIRKFKAITLISLIGCMGLTMTYAYPKPENNWGQQEIYWEAEFKAVDFLVFYVYLPNNTLLTLDCPITIDTDLRLSIMIEGYSGIEATYGHNWTSWLARSLYFENETLEAFLTSTKPVYINSNIDYLFISDVLIDDGFITDWANYGTEKEGWILKLSLNGSYLPLNPFLHRIYNNNIVYLMNQS